MAKQSDPNATLSVGGIVSDIRQKLVEEAWFGRALSGQEQPTYYDTVRSIYGEPKEAAPTDRHLGPEIER